MTLDIFLPMTPKLRAFMHTHGSNYIDGPAISLIPVEEVDTAIKDGFPMPKIKNIESTGVRFNFAGGRVMVHSDLASVEIEFNGTASIHDRSSAARIRHLSQLVRQSCVLDFWPPIKASHVSIILGDPLVNTIPAEVIWADLRPANRGRRSSKWIGSLNTDLGVWADLWERNLMVEHDPFY